MNQRNQEIEKFLTYYFNMHTAPRYAVMLKGKWGSGKTWFVENTLGKLRSYGGKVLYVSLYGVSSQQQIEQEFFRQLHPVLGSKTGALAGKLLKGLVKGALKIDLNGDGKDDGTLTIGVPDINLPEYLRDTKKFALVFDDLERCSLAMNEVLGYINYFVEHDGYKVIIVANEDEILKNEKKNEHGVDDEGSSKGDLTEADAGYLRIKEKLIGKTFEITPDIDEAITTFLLEVDNLQHQKFFEKNKDEIQKIYAASDYKNLRHLRQALLDYARLLDILSIDALKNDEMLTHLLSMFLLYSFEIKSATLQPGDIGKIRSSFMRAALASKTEKDTHYKILAKKYPGIDLLDEILPGALWDNMFATGLFNAEEINKALLNSKYFMTKEKPDWIRLWHAYDLTDDEVTELLASVWNHFTKNEYTNLGVLRHVVGSLLELSQMNIFDRTKDEILSIARANLQNMKSSGVLQREFNGDLDLSRGTSFAGLGYQSKDTAEFQALSNEIEVLGREAIEASYPTKSRELLKLMKDDTPEFCRSLILVNDHTGLRYYDIPILMYISAKEFVEVLETLSGAQMRLVRDMIEYRYTQGFLAEKLRSEQSWLLEVLEMVHATRIKRAGKMSGAHFAHMITTLESALLTLKNA